MSKGNCAVKSKATPKAAAKTRKPATQAGEKPARPPGRKTAPSGKTIEPKKPRGRPCRYSPEVDAEICARLAEGEPLRQICRSSEHLPHWNTVYDWMEADKEFAGRIARARERGEEAISHECLEIADEQPSLTSFGGVDGGDIQHKKLRIWTRLELLKKWNPKKWGDKVDMNHGVQPDNPLAKLFEQIKGTPLRPSGEGK